MQQDLQMGCSKNDAIQSSLSVIISQKNDKYWYDYLYRGK